MRDGRDAGWASGPAGGAKTGPGRTSRSEDFHLARRDLADPGQGGGASVAVDDWSGGVGGRVAVFFETVGLHEAVGTWLEFYVAPSRLHARTNFLLVPALPK